MREIKIVKDPDISLDQLNYVIEKSFTAAENVKFANYKFDPELYEKLKKENELACFAAMDGDKVVGTITYTTVNWKRWYYMGKAPKLRFLAVLPEYQGRHIGKRLLNTGGGYSQQKGYEMMFLSTPSKNKTAINMYKKFGFKILRYKYAKNHGTIELGWWKNGCPYSAVHIKLRYIYSVIKTGTKVIVLGIKQKIK